ncbi:hypothetical protein ACH5RR_009557 [Cinchona calisaya]|uniref:Glabrous enhancer-binding protein-like DBD domain-containing protein n=1 Tax=Cinchona calisaya TaxID=153742 RepID=A0ABD3AHU0_9GENT
MAAPPPPAPIPSDTEILNRIYTYKHINGSEPKEDGEVGMEVFVRIYLHSNADPQLVRQRINTLDEQYMARRHMLERGRERAEDWPRLDQEIFALSHRLWYNCRYSESDTTEDETNLSGPPLSNDSTSLDEPSSIHRRQHVDHQSSPLDQTNQASTSRTYHSDDLVLQHMWHRDIKAANVLLDTPTTNPNPNSNPNSNPSDAENTPERSYSADVSNNTNVSPDEDTPQNYSSADQSNTNTTVSKDSASSSMTKRRRLFDNLNQQGGDRDTTAAPAAQDINILTRMVTYSEANNGVYPSVSAETLSEFVKNWLHSDADPGEVGKRIQELREMYGKYLMMNNNDDEGGKPVYSDSRDDRLLLDLSKKLWHHEFGNPNDDSAGGKSSDDKS